MYLFVFGVGFKADRVTSCVLLIFSGCTAAAYDQEIIEEEVNAYFNQMPDNVQCAMIDIDVSLDVYAYLKSKKIVSAIPTLLCYHKENISYVPDDIHTGTDRFLLNTFFENCKEAAASALE